MWFDVCMYIFYVFIEYLFVYAARGSQHHPTSRGPRLRLRSLGWISKWLTTARSSGFWQATGHFHRETTEIWDFVKFGKPSETITSDDIWWHMFHSPIPRYSKIFQVHLRADCTPLCWAVSAWPWRITDKYLDSTENIRYKCLEDTTLSCFDQKNT